MGIYEISKILNGATRLEQTLANVVNALSCFFDRGLGMIVIFVADDEPEIIATAGWATEAKGKPNISHCRRIDNSACPRSSLALRLGALIRQEVRLVSSKAA